MLGKISSQLEVLIRILHDRTLSILESTGRKTLYGAYKFWKELGTTQEVESSIPFNMVDRACHASQPSFASTKLRLRHFENSYDNEAQSLLSVTREMSELIHVLVHDETYRLLWPQSDYFPFEEDAMKRIVAEVAIVVL